MNNDLISREALRKELTSETRDEFEFVCLSRVLEKIDKAQAAEPEYVYLAKVTFDEDKLKELTDDIVERIKNGDIVVKDERPQGEWEEIKTSCYIGHKFFCCSKCNREIDLIEGESLEDYPFCHCGADMRKGGAEE